MTSELEWSSLVREFCRLGGIAENISNRQGEYGRGIFPTDPRCSSRIFTPKSLLMKADSLSLKGDKISINDESGLSPDERSFAESYYNLLSWGGQGNCASSAFLRELRSIPEVTKKILLDNKFIANSQLGLDADCKEHVLKRFIAERHLKFQGEWVLAPFWELVNHSAFAPSLRVTIKGVETPPRPPSGSEILQKYRAKDSPIGMWQSYGFSCRSVFAYSVPVRININSTPYVLQCDGGQRGSNAKQGVSVKYGAESITIGSLVVGCISKDLPLSILRSLMGKLSFSDEGVVRLLCEIQDVNLNIRREVLSSLGNAELDGCSALRNALQYEIELIQQSM